MVQAPDLVAAPAAEIVAGALSPVAPAIPADVAIGGGVMFGLPCYGGHLSDATLRGMLDAQALFAAQGVPFSYVTTRNESLVQRARNTIVAHFLASSARWLMFVDADIGFSGRQVLRLLAHDRPIIGGLYRRKTLHRIDWVVNLLPPVAGARTVRRDPATGAIQVAAIGTGFMLIRRDVIEAMLRRYPQTRYQTAASDGAPGEWRHHTYALFDCWIDETGNYLSEDYAFCRRWRDMGGEIWADPGIILGHHGTAEFLGDPMSGIEILPEVAA